MRWLPLVPMKAFLLLFFVGAWEVRNLAADEPSVVPYLTTKENMEKGTTSELILKVNNPTDRTFYVYGTSITDIPCQVEVLQNGKWIVVPPRRCGWGMSTRPFLPHSDLVFTVNEAPLDERDLAFRIRVYLYTIADITSLYVDPPKQEWIECVSPVFRSNDFRQKREQDIVLPRVPGGQPVIVPGEKSGGGAPKDPFAK